MSINIVSVQQGKLSGKNCKTSNNTPFYAYKSIPYAKPPVGELRFSVSNQKKSYLNCCKMCKVPNNIFCSKLCCYTFLFYYYNVFEIPVYNIII